MGREICKDADESLLVLLFVQVEHENHVDLCAKEAQRQVVCVCVPVRMCVVRAQVCCPFAARVLDRMVALSASL